MSTKTQVLKILEQNRGSTVSGTILARALKLSRAAVWKAVEELRREGYEIHAVTNKGYSLSAGSDLLSAEGILLYLQHPNIGRDQLFVYKTLESTNQLAKRMAVEGAAHGTVLLAEEQTKGRGRLGRSFFSPKESGIYMSMILRPASTADKAVLVTTAASVAVCRALSQTLGIEAQIKWVNDIYLNSRKVCGILTEAVSDFETGSIEALILGIGVNFSTPREGFPDDINKTAGSLLESKNRFLLSRNRLAAAIIDQVLTVNDDFESASFISEYKSRSLILGKEIVVHRGNQPFEAKAIDINQLGGLVVQKSDGSREILNSGEITIRPQAVR